MTEKKIFNHPILDLLCCTLLNFCGPSDVFMCHPQQLPRWTIKVKAVVYTFPRCDENKIIIMCDNDEAYKIHFDTFNNKIKKKKNSFLTIRYYLSVPSRVCYILE